MTDRTDNFNRTDTTSNIGTPSDGGSAWSQLAGTWGINSNKAYESAGSSLSAVVLESSVSDVDVQATAVTVSAVVGLIARAADNNNYLNVSSASGSGTSMYKRVAGSFTQLGSHATSAVDGDVLKFTVNGSSLTLYLNGVSRITATDSAGSTNTQHGLRSHNDASFRVDDFSITAIAAAGHPAMRRLGGVRFARGVGSPGARTF
jgi:hypothetical protein